MAHTQQTPDPTNPDRETDTQTGSLSAPHLVTLADALDIITDGDLLLYRRRGSLISIAGRGIHSHVAMFAWWDDCPMTLETRGVKDARAITLASQVAKFPGRIDVFEANPENKFAFDRRGAVRLMRSFMGQRYSWPSVWRVAFHHLALFRWFFRASTDDDADGHLSLFCSHAVAKATRIGGGVDAVSNLADQHTEPADLARSPFYRYRCTLIPE